ncbi:MAG TPA: hypothetical protein VJK27_12475 [Terriglobales bacterium]|jgi:hypothetical protein|nr:hypothetical protein [Terriglobales bacterium]
MQSLIELVAASFARHGIESAEPVERLASSSVAADSAHTQTAEPTLVTALPEHNFRKSLQGDPAP